MPVTHDPFAPHEVPAPVEAPSSSASSSSAIPADEAGTPPSPEAPKLGDGEGSGPATEEPVDLLAGNGDADLDADLDAALAALDDAPVPTTTRRKRK